MSWSWEQIAEENRVLKAGKERAEQERDRAKLELSAARREVSRLRAAVRIAQGSEGTIHQITAPALVVIEQAGA